MNAMFCIVRRVALVFGFLGGLAVMGACASVYVFWTYGPGLPDHTWLAAYEPSVTTRVLAGDGRLLTEYAIERRVFVPVSAVPPRVIHAFIAAEDQNFYHHIGIDPLGILRAALTNLRNAGSGRRPVGASTITQQVAQTFLLTKEVSLERKIREAILSLRIERAYGKDRILELYLNEIYLGFGAYGVAAAARNYFGKSLEELTIAEASFIAALPKAPNHYNPIRRPEAARARRDYVIGRMLEDGYISRAEAEEALAAPIEVRPPIEGVVAVNADYFAEEVRRTLAGRFGEAALYEGGLTARTTLDPRLQRIAEPALRSGLIDYDRRHGWRGPVARIDFAGGAAPADWPAGLGAVARPPGAGEWRLALVLAVEAETVTIGLGDGGEGQIPLAELRWARFWLKGQLLGPAVRKPADVLAPGDVVLIEPAEADADGKVYPAESFGLRQIPEVSGALVAIDPHTGRVLAMVGGFSHEISEFNRATQAWRQPGSAFKPFVYMSALDAGFTPSSIILDAPFVIDQGAGLGLWRPDNYEGRFYGQSTLRLGVEKSRNVMTVRLARAVGMDKIALTAERFGVVDDLPAVLAMALGAGETTLMRLTAAYAMIANGGHHIVPTLLDRVQDRYGRTIYRRDFGDCPGCRDAWAGQEPPVLSDPRERVEDARTAYQMVSLLQGVIERGTGRTIAELDRPLAGKTGTTNDSKDAWFIGFSPDLAVGVYVGFDTPRGLGRRETGASTAAPIFKRFMAEALNEEPIVPFRIPPGVHLVRVNATTGLAAQPGDRDVILEAFKGGTGPDRTNAISGRPREAAAAPARSLLLLGQY